MGFRCSLVRASLYALLVSALAACAGGGGIAANGSSTTLPPAGHLAPSGAAAGTVTGSLVLALPSRSPGSTQRSPRFLSPSSASATVAVNGTAVATADVSATSTLCTPSGTARSCTISFAAPVGNDTLAVDLYDGANGSGKHLATGTAPFAVTAGTPFSASVQMRALVATATIAVTGSFTSGTPATLPITISALDADGNVVSGSAPFAAPITLAQSDTSGHITLSATTVASPATAVSLVYDGTAIGTPGTTTTISVSGSGAGAIAPATVTLATPARSVLTNGDFSSPLTTGWTTGIVRSYGTYPHIDTSNAANCYTAQNGNPFAYIDSPLGSDGYFQQNVTVPMTTSPILSFRTWGNLDPVSTSVRVILGGTETVLDTFTPPPLQASASTCSGATAVSKRYSLTAYAGQTITLRIRSTSTGFNGTIADFDDFVIQ